MKTYPIRDVTGDKYLNPAPPATRPVGNVQKIISWLSSYAQVLSSAFSGDMTYKVSQDYSSRYGKLS